MESAFRRDCKHTIFGKIARTHKPVVMSTGMGTMEEIGEAIRILKSNGAGEIKLLQCTTEYPAEYKNVNLNAMRTLADTFHVKTGLSDHTKGIEIPIAAVALGANVIENISHLIEIRYDQIIRLV